VYDTPEQISLDSRTSTSRPSRVAFGKHFLDDALRPAGEPQRLTPEFDGWMDAAVADQCGFLWVPEFFESRLYRFNTTTGDFTFSECQSFDCYGHSVTFGVDAFGWNPRAIYMPRPYAGGLAVEVLTGVRCGKYSRTWNSEPVALITP
jgi:hypothetical protein